MRALITWALLLLSSATFAAPPVAPAPLFDARQYSAGLGTGLTVEWASTDLGIREFDPLAVRDIKQRGFGHVVVKISGDATPQRLLHLRKIVEACDQYNLVPIFAWQGPAKGLTEPTFVHGWQTIASYFHGQYPALSFMLLSEGERDTRTTSALNRLYDPAIKAIARIDPQRIVIVTPHLHGAPEMLNELRLPTGQPRLLVSWHLFGQGPQKVNGRTPWAKGTAAEKGAVRARIRAVMRWQQKTGYVTLVSAFTPLTANEGNTPVARSLASFVACELRQAKIPLTLGQGERFYDGEEGAWRPAMSSLVDDVLHPDCSSPVKAGSIKPVAGGAVHSPAAASTGKS